MSFLKAKVKTYQVEHQQQMQEKIKKELMPPVPSITEKEKKKKEYEIGEDLKDIIDNIIRQKPSITDLRKALKEYAKVATDEHYNDEDD